MDEGHQRVGTSRARNRISKTTSKPASSTPRSSAQNKKQRKKKKDQVFYAVKQILDEKTVEGKEVLYLIDWEDNEETGEKYEPTWEPYSYCTPAAIATWQNRQLESQSAPTVSSEAESPAALESPDDSQPVRAAKRKRTSNHSIHTTRGEEDGEEASAPKKPRLGEATDLVEIQPTPRKEVQDSYEDEPSSSEPPNVRVEIHAQEGFDPSEYSRLVTSSQLPSEDQSRLHTSTPSTAHRLSSVIWDEEIDDIVVPDSHEQVRESSLYEPSSTPSKPETSGPTTQAQTPDFESVDFLPTQLTSSAFGEVLQSCGDSQVPQSSGSGVTHIQTDTVESSSLQQDAQLVVVISRTPEPSSQTAESSPRTASPEIAVTQDPIQIASPAEDISGQLVESELDKEKSQQSSTPSKQLSLQTSTSLKDSQEYPSQSSHLPSPPLDRVLASIENHVGLNSSPSPSSSSSAVALSQDTMDQNSGAGTYGAGPPKMEAPKVASEPVEFNAMALINELRQKKRQEKQAEIAARRLARASGSGSTISTPAPASPAPPSPSPAVLNQEVMRTNHEAVAANQTMPTSFDIEDISVPLVTSPITTSPIVTAPVAGSSLSIQPPAEISMPELLTTSNAAISNDALRSSPPLVDAPESLNEYTIPLPLVALTRDIYTQTLRKYRNQRSLFVTQEVLESSLVGEIDEMLDQLEKICSHQDLIQDDYFTQRNNTDYEQAKYAENISTKCIFVSELLEPLRAYPLHIVILARPGRMMEILEAICKFHEYSYNRADHPLTELPGSSGDETQLRITLYPTGDSSLSIRESPSAVIAFDSTCGNVTEWAQLRRFNRTPADGLAPYLSLVVLNSIEHIDLSLNRNMETTERKIRLVKCFAHLMDHVGILDAAEGFRDPPAAAKDVADFLASGSIEDAWPLRALPEIEEVDNDMDSAEQNQASYSNVVNTPRQSPHKRQLSVEYSGRPESPKRQRMTPTVGEENNSGPSNMSSTAGMTSTPNSRVPSNTSGGQPGEGAQVSALSKRIAVLERTLKEKEETEAGIRDINSGLEARYKDLESSFTVFGVKYREALNDRGQFEQDMKIAQKAESVARDALNTKVAQLATLREQKAAVDIELAAARIALTTSAVPEQAEMANMANEVERLKVENERLQKRLGSMKHDLEYMRTQYQTSSSAAAESANEVRALEAEIVTLREKADSNKVRIHEIQRDGEIATFVQRINNLKAERDDLKIELEKRGEELKAVMNGRRPTRGTSVPRSPRMAGGSTMSPGQRANMRVIAGNSRSNSPAPGELGRQMFGDALFQNPAGRERWGNHLQ